MARARSSIPESTLRDLIAGNAIHTITVVGGDGGFSIRIDYGATSTELASTRGSARRFASIDTAAAVLRRLGAPSFHVDVSGYMPGLIRSPRPDRAAALRAAAASNRTSGKQPDSVVNRKGNRQPSKRSSTR